MLFILFELVALLALLIAALIEFRCCYVAVWCCSVYIGSALRFELVYNC